MILNIFQRHETDIRVVYELLNLLGCNKSIIIFSDVRTQVALERTLLSSRGIFFKDVENL